MPSTSSRRTARYFSYQLLAMVGKLAEMFAGMKKVDRPFVGSELFEKRSVVRRGVGDSNQFGPHLADMSDLFGELRHRLAGFRPKTERFLPSASWKLTVPQDARHASSSPSGRTPSSETAHGFAGFRLAGPRITFRTLPCQTSMTCFNEAGANCPR